MTEALVVEMGQQRREKLFASLHFRFGGFAADANPRLDERSHQPRPHRPLVICTVPLAHTALVMRRVSILAGSKRSQPYRRQQPRFDGVNDAARACALQCREWQSAYCEDLIWTAHRIVDARAMVAINDVVEAAACFVPETRLERLARLGVDAHPALVDRPADLQRVEP